MTTLYLVTEGYTEVTREADPNERWDGDDLAHDNRVEEVLLSKPKGYSYEEFEVGFGVKVGDKVYVLTVTHSTGDSFHHETGCLAIVDVYEDFKVAAFNKKKIDANNRKPDSDMYIKIKFELADGEVKLNNYSCGWEGYFENVESIDIESYQIIA